jgi:hypothetical protein
MEENKNLTDFYAGDNSFEKFIYLYGFAESIPETVKLYRRWAMEIYFNARQNELLYAEGFARGYIGSYAKSRANVETEIKIALEAFRLAKSVSDFPAIVETMKSYKIAEVNIETALKEATAEERKNRAPL